MKLVKRLLLIGLIGGTLEYFVPGTLHILCVSTKQLAKACLKYYWDRIL